MIFYIVPLQLGYFRKTIKTLPIPILFSTKYQYMKKMLTTEIERILRTFPLISRLIFKRNDKLKKSYCLEGKIMDSLVQGVPFFSHVQRGILRFSHIFRALKR